jgi:class 3 adenylate cyclase/tetratricopeptide (TPR) repeat protein
LVSVERRTVSILFVDLVGFTERSDRADPEDVRRTLVPFHRRVKEDLERFGGTLDKFIGDAVMGVFGAPIAHGDDPARAVHAALQILRSLDDLRRADPDIAVRVAVNTGEAVVSFGSGPQVGEAVAGDVVNTASRMQSLAPQDSIVIGETTLRAVRHLFEVEALPPATVKGKSEPLQVWQVLGERAELEVEHPPFVGRRRELEWLVERFGEVERSGSSRVVTIVADAGVGKSRLEAELVARLRGRARALGAAAPAYGEGTTFAPIEQTIRGLTGVQPSEGDAASVEGLEALVARTESNELERRWLVRTLGSVLALEAVPDGSAISADEIAQAWARVLGDAAAERPLLLVIENLYDASPAFVEVLATTADLLDRWPVLIVATTRPTDELPSSWTELARASTLELGPLEHDDARDLLGSVLVEGVSEAARAAVLERSAGNPLYAIEFARMLADSGGDEAETPASVQAVIAARLDAIPSELRSLAVDASVVGDEVWPDAVVSMDHRAPPDVERGLERLTRRGLLVHRASSLPELDAYGFAHGLIREVAYGRLPRSARARRHLAVARWLEDASGDRTEEWAESLARHYATAAELAHVAGEPEIRSEAAEPAVRWLVAAGDRASRIDPAAAFAAFDRALAFASAETPGRDEALWRSASTGRRVGSLDASEVLARHEEALAIARTRGDEIAAGEALTRIGNQLGAMGEGERARAALAESVEILERHPPGRPLARAYAYRAEEELFAGNTRDAMAFADRALSLLEDDTDEIAVMSLHLRGDARCSTGDLEGGLADLEDALRRSEEGGRVGDIVTSLNYLAEWRWAIEGPAAGIAEWEAAIDLAERRNVRSQATYAKGGALWALLEAGEWDRVLEWSAELLALPSDRLDPVVSIVAQASRAHVLLGRGRRSEVADPDELVTLAERVQELHAISPALVVAAAVALADGEVERAASRLEEFEKVTEGVAPEYRSVDIAREVRLCLETGRQDIAERLVAGSDPVVMRDQVHLEAARAMVAEARGDPEAGYLYARSAERLHEYGDPFEEAMALLGQARATGAEEPGQQARAILERLGV